jgi:hypothetical protein
VGVTVHLDFIEPVLYMGECFFASDIVDKECTNCTSVIRPGDGPEILLACGVPDLEFYVFIFHGDGFGTEFNADCNIVGGSGFSLNELKYDA